MTKILHSQRDKYFLPWQEDAWINQRDAVIATFEYVSVKSMQRGDITPESKEWLSKNQEQNKNLREKIAKSIPRDGMISPLILVSVNHRHWKKVDNYFWKSIPFVIHTGNNRFQYAIENGYTHISSILLGIRVDPRTWNYLQDELKKPNDKNLRVSKDKVFSDIGEWEDEGWIKQ